MSAPKPDLQDYKIETIYAAIAVGDDGREGIFGMMTENGWMPLVFSDRARLDDYKMMVMQVARAGGVTVTLRTYTLSEDCPLT